MRGPAAAALLAAAVLMAPVFAQEEILPHAQDRPPNPPKSPEEAVRAMVVPPGFTVEVVASEPDLVNPVAMTFDEKGRIWVTESLEYPRREAGPGRDRVKVLEDRDGDGKAERVTVFADGLNIPSGVAVGHGGVWVANAPDILFYPDADRDGRPDGPPEVIVTGFGRIDTHELPNSLTWGPDGWLYGWNGVFNPSRVTNRKGRTFAFTCAIFRIHPRTRDFEIWCEGTSNPWGLAINETGDLFASACVIDHLWHLTETGYYIRQGGPYPAHTWPMGSIVEHRHQKAAYCGVHWFDSPAYPPEFRKKLYMGNIHGNCINVDILERRGSTYEARPAPDFLTANDAWFMPVVQTTGPDGCLYVLDWYDRYHCYQDANRDPAGIDRLKGRLYRVRYQDTPRRFGFDLAGASAAELSELLGGANVYDRAIAQRLLTERLAARSAAPGVGEALGAELFDEALPREARLRRLWVLLGSGALAPAVVSRLLDHPDPAFRAWAVRAAGSLGGVPAALRERLAALAGDPSPDVRLQVAIAAGKIEGLDPIPVLMEVLSASGEDPLIPHIVWQNLHPLLEDRADAFLAVLETSAWERQGGVGRILPRVLDRLVGRRQPDITPVVRLTTLLLEGPHADVAGARHCLNALARQVQSGELAGDRLRELRRLLAPELRFYIESSRVVHPLRDAAALLAASWGDAAGKAQARSILETGGLGDAERLQALDALVSGRDPELLEFVIGLVADRGGGSTVLRGRMIDALSRYEHPRLAEAMIACYPRLEAELKPRIIVLLTERPAWGRALLSAVERGEVPREALGLNPLRKLLATRDPTIAGRVKALYGTVREGRNPQRELVVGQMRNFLQKTPGDPIAGRAVFDKLCAACHKIHGAGQDIGPDLTLNGRNDFEQLLSNVFDPNLVIGPAYQATTVVTRDGRVLTGLLAEDNPERIILKLQGGMQETIPRAEIEAVKTADVSFMPEDTEQQLSPQEIADLFAFLALDKPPEDPTARRLPGAPAPRR